MKIVNDNLTGDLSLVDKVWNDAMETAALHCEDRAHALFGMNGGDESWVWPAGRRIRDMAEEFRKEKRK
jgi:hypothetical protein